MTDQGANCIIWTKFHPKFVCTAELGTFGMLQSFFNNAEGVRGKNLLFGKQWYRDCFLAIYFVCLWTHTTKELSQLLTEIVNYHSCFP